MSDRDRPIIVPTSDRERMALYRTLLTELTEANDDMRVGAFKVFKQAAGSEEMQEITAEAIRTNQVSIVLLEAAIALAELGSV
jgi:hypothetical protein